MKVRGYVPKNKNELIDWFLCYYSGPIYDKLTKGQKIRMLNCMKSRQLYAIFYRSKRVSV